MTDPVDPGGANDDRSTRPRDRVNDAIRHRKPDRLPRDFAAVPGVWDRLQAHFGAPTRAEVLVRLGIDCRVVSYDSYCAHPDVPPEAVDPQASLERSSVGGMWRRWGPDGSNRDIWGAHRRRVAAAHGAHEEFASYPLGDAQSLDELRRYRWPTPDWWCFDSLPADIAALNRPDIYNIRFRVGSIFETAWSLYGFERFLCDLAADPVLPRYIMERITEVHVANLRATCWISFTSTTTSPRKPPCSYGRRCTICTSAPSISS